MKKRSVILFAVLLVLLAMPVIAQDEGLVGVQTSQGTYAVAAFAQSEAEYSRLIRQFESDYTRQALPKSVIDPITDFVKEYTWSFVLIIAISPELNEYIIMMDRRGNVNIFL